MKYEDRAKRGGWIRGAGAGIVLVLAAAICMHVGRKDVLKVLYMVYYLQLVLLP